MAFYVGQRVECVDVRSPVIRGRPRDLQCREGAVYTVSGVRNDPPTGLPSLQLAELPTGARNDCWYQAKRFRPIVETKTDISIFTRMLKPQKVEA